MERFKLDKNLEIDSSTVKKMEEEVFSNLKAVKYLHSIGLNDDLIRKHIDKIYDFAVDMNNCKGCKGLSYCNKDPKHLVSSVIFKDGVVDRNIIPCKKYLEFTNFKKRFVMFDFPEEWLENKITEDVRNNRSKAKLEVLSLYSKAIKGESNRWVFMKGDIASGKSFYAGTLCVDAARNGSFNKIVFINIPNKFKELSDLAFSKNPNFNNEIEKIQNSDLLVLDDFGNEFKSDFVRDNILFPILSYRVRNKLFTIITSNYSIDDCASMYQTSNASKPKIEQIRQMLNLMCKKEILIIDPSLQ